MLLVWLTWFQKCIISTKLHKLIIKLFKVLKSNKSNCVIINSYRHWIFDIFCLIIFTISNKVDYFLRISYLTCVIINWWRWITTSCSTTFWSWYRTNKAIIILLKLTLIPCNFTTHRFCSNNYLTFLLNIK